MRRLARLRRSEDQQVRRHVHRVVGHRQVRLAHAERHRPPGAVVGLRARRVRIEFVQVDALRQHPHLRRLVGVLRADVLHRRRDRRHEVVGAVHAVEPRHPHHQVVLLHRDRAAGPVRRDLAGDAVDLRLVHVAEPELDLGAEVVADARLQLGPARRRDHRVHAERQALPGEVLDHGLEVGELRDERRPAVDHQEHVAERVGGRRDGSDLRASAGTPRSSRRGTA